MTSHTATASARLRRDDTTRFLSVAGEAYGEGGRVGKFIEIHKEDLGHHPESLSGTLL